MILDLFKSIYNRITAINIKARGRIQFANDINMPANSNLVIFLFERLNEKAVIANERKGISVPAGNTTMIFEYVKQNKTIAIFAVRFEKNLFAKYHTFIKMLIFKNKLIK